MTQDGHANPGRMALAAQNDGAARSDTSIAEAIEDLVVANHILSDQGVVDAFGHISMRHPQDGNRFLLARNMAPGQVTAEDILEFTLDGEAVDADGKGVYLERFIHGQIYQRRPDVMSVAHSHSHSVVPLTVVRGQSLRPLFHMAGFIGTGAPLFEIQDVVGDGSDLLISNNVLGSALADSLGHHNVVMMRGHGSTVVADSVQQAVYRAVYVELNARFQIAASQMGDVVFLTEAEAKATAARTDGQVKRPWDLWKMTAQDRRKSGRHS